MGRASGQPLVSVLIPTRNGSRWLDALLTGLAQQSRPPDEILVVDSESGDDSVAIARRHGARVLSVAAADFDHGATRTMAAQAAVGELLVCCTQDVLPAEREALARLLAALDDPAVAVAYGRQLPWPQADFFAAALREFNYGERAELRSLADCARLGFRATFVSNSFAVWRRSALASVGWFPAGLIFGEDACTVAQLLEAGQQVAYVPEARVFHSHNYTTVQEFRRYFDVGVFHRSQAALLARFGSPAGEGGRYLRFQVERLHRQGRWLLWPEFLLRNGARFCGYTLGRRQALLPRALARACSLNRAWWSRPCETGRS
ncbi:MAG: hypothetical protein BWK76_10750 [Desulfobulbaceae bacterium A2]|nr:MAG: hypothetical protein BWK76_10750 [Desulfobulbaceae bacterium A2]